MNNNIFQMILNKCENKVRLYSQWKFVLNLGMNVIP